MEKNKFTQFGNRLGHIFAVIVMLCLIAMAIGLTVKFLFWLF